MWPETLGSWASLEASACVPSCVGGCVHVCVRRVYHRTARMHVGARAHVRVCAGVCDGDVSGVTCACVTLLCVRVPRACLCVCTGRRASPPAMFTCTNVGACGSLETCTLCTFPRVPAGTCVHVSTIMCMSTEGRAVGLDLASLPVQDPAPRHGDLHLHGQRCQGPHTTRCKYSNPHFR